MFFNARAAFKLLVDWKGMVTTCRFVEDAYAALDRLPDRGGAGARARAPRCFVHLVPAFHEPAIAETLSALLGSRYPHGRLHVIVVTAKRRIGAAPGDAGHDRRSWCGASAPTLPPWQQKMLTLVVARLAGGRKAHQLNWALRPETLRGRARRDAGTRHAVYVGVSDADSLPDANVYRWIAADVLGGRGRTAYQGSRCRWPTSSGSALRGRVCAVQQSSIFIRVSIARLINEVQRVAWFGACRPASPRLAGLVRPAFELGFRRSQICLGHNHVPAPRPVDLRSTAFRLRRHRGLHARLRARRPRRPHRGPARWWSWSTCPRRPTSWSGRTRAGTRACSTTSASWCGSGAPRRRAFNFAQLARHVGNKVVEWPIAARRLPGGRLPRLAPGLPVLRPPA